MACSSLLFLCFSLVIYGASSLKISVGALFDDQVTLRLLQQNFNSVTTIEDNTFELLTEKVDSKDPYLIAKAASRLLKRNALVLIVPSTSGGYSILQSLSTNVQVPLVSLSERFHNEQEHDRQDFLVNLQPETFNATLEVLRKYRWNSVVYLYDRVDGPERAARLMDLGFGNLYSKISTLNKVTHADVGATLLRRLELIDRQLNILLDLEPALAEELLTSYSRSDNSQFHHTFLLMSPMDNLFWKKNREQRSPLNITGFQVYDMKSEDVTRMVKSLGKVDIRSKTRGLLAIDACKLVADALSRLVQAKPNFVEEAKGFYTNISSKFPHGEITKQFLFQTVLHEGLTGPVHFDNEGRRSGCTISVFESNQNSVKETFSWNDQTGLIAIANSDFAPKSVLKGKRLKVTTIIQEPYTMAEKNANGHFVFTGYCKDLLDLLSNRLGFEYELKLAADGRYGMKNDLGKWNGMIGEIVNKEADLTCADLSMTSARKEVVDFSHPFQTAGISLMVKRPNLPPAIGPGSCDYFFFRVFTPEAWGCILGSTVVAGLLYYSISKLTDTTLDFGTGDRISVGLLSSLWFAFVSILLHGVSKQPGSTSSRFISVIWWLFVLFSLTLYLGGLTAMLLAHHYGNPVLDFQEELSRTTIQGFIEEALNKNYPKVGLVKAGSTRAFFKNSNNHVYQRFNQYLEDNPDAIVQSYEEGVERVQVGDYAFLMDSTANVFHINTKCDLAMYRQLEYTKGLGLALSKNSPFTSDLNVGLLSIVEKGQLKKLYNTYFLQNDTCPKYESSYRDLYHSSITLQNIGGLFYCLVVGVILTFFVTATEYCIERRKRPDVSLTRIRRGENSEEQDQRTFL